MKIISLFLLFIVFCIGCISSYNKSLKNNPNKINGVPKYIELKDTFYFKVICYSTNCDSNSFSDCFAINLSKKDTLIIHSFNPIDNSIYSGDTIKVIPEKENQKYKKVNCLVFVYFNRDLVCSPLYKLNLLHTWGKIEKI